MITLSGTWPGFTGQSRRLQRSNTVTGTEKTPQSILTRANCPADCQGRGRRVPSRCSERADPRPPPGRPEPSPGHSIKWARYSVSQGRSAHPLREARMGDTTSSHSSVPSRWVYIPMQMQSSRQCTPESSTTEALDVAGGLIAQCLRDSRTTLSWSWQGSLPRQRPNQRPLLGPRAATRTYQDGVLLCMHINLLG